VSSAEEFHPAFIVFCFLACDAATVVGQESIVAITHVNVIDATGTPVQTDMTVIVQGKQIVQIGKSDATTLTEDSHSRGWEREVSDPRAMGHACA